MFENDLPSLKTMHLAAEKVLRFSESCNNIEKIRENEMRYDAIIMNLVLIDEFNDKLSVELKKAYTTIDWDRLAESRSRVASYSLGIDHEKVWKLIKTTLPQFRENLEIIINDLK